MTHFRPFRNADSPALTALWNRGADGPAVARPLSVHEFDLHVVGRPHFEAGGLIVAERGGRPVGFAHAGFGPHATDDPPLRLSHDLGTVAMIVVEPEAAADPDLATGLLDEAERYLRDRGASVVYAGGQFPLNPFYWGVYGGSEWAGVLDGDAAFNDAVTRAGFEPVSTTVLLRADLSAPEPRDPRAVLVRRQARVEAAEDALPDNWWQALAVGDFRPSLFRLVAKGDGRELARATTWDMTWFGRRDGRSRLGLIGLEVVPGQRRKGYGRFLVAEILRTAREQGTALVEVQTGAANPAALGLYRSLGFEPVGSSVLYRRPGRTS